MAESRMEKAQKNIVMSVMQNALGILLTFVSRVIFVRILDVSYLGINGLFTGILNILSLADLGMGTAMMYSLYKPIAEEDTKKITALISFFKKIYLAIAVVILITGIAILPFLDYIVKLEKPVPNLEWYYILALINVVISYLFIYRTTLLSADQKNYILSKYNMIFRIVTFVTQMIVLILFKNYLLYLLSELIVKFIGNLYQNFVTIKIYPYLKERSRELDQGEKKGIWRDVKATFLYKISGTIQSNTDNILISIFVGTVFVGYYSNYTMIITAVVSILTLVFTSIKSGVGNLLASKGTSQKDKRFLFDVINLFNYWGISFCSICFVCLFQDFIEIFFGKEYTLNLSVVAVIVINFYTSNIRQTIWLFRETSGIFHETRYITAVTAAINLFLSLLFGYLWGMTGIVAATVIARMVYAWWKEPKILFHKLFGEGARKYYVTYIKQICLCIFLGFVTYIICDLMPSRNIMMHFIGSIIVCVVVPNAILYICYSKSPEFGYVWGRLPKNRLFRKE